RGDRRALQHVAPARPARPPRRPGRAADGDRPAEEHPVTTTALTESARVAAFDRHVAAGGKVEAGDWMPEEYRTAVRKFVEMHANSELMGVLPEREWILRAPTLKRKLALNPNVQDERGHAQL